MSLLVAQRRLALAGGCCGLLYWLAMPGVGLGLLAFVVFLPLYLFRPERAVDSMAAGFLAGVVATLGVCAWLPASARLMLGASAVFGALVLAAACAWHGVLFALAALLNHRARVQGVPGWLRLPLSVIAAELLVPLPFPFSFAVTVYSLPALLQIADLTGRLGVVFVLGSASAALGDAVCLMRTKLRPRAAWRSVCYGLTPLLMSVAYAGVRMPQVEREIARAAKLTVGLVQPNLAPWIKRADPRQSLSEHLQLTRELLAREPALDLILWSETAMPMPLDERLLPMGLRYRFGQEFRVPLLLGAVTQRELPEQQTALTNSALLSSGDGYVCPACRYDKQTLMPFAEAMPGGNFFSRPSKFDVGSHARALPFDSAHAIATLICFEAIFPERVRQLVRRDRPQLLVNLTNDGWFGDSGEPRLHFALATLRAVEHRLYFVRVAATGISAVVDPLGRARVTIPRGTRQAAVGSVAWLEAHSCYGFLGDAPWWLLTALIVFAGSSRFMRFCVRRR